MPTGEAAKASQKAKVKKLHRGQQGDNHPGAQGATPPESGGELAKELPSCYENRRKPLRISAGLLDQNRPFSSTVASPRLMGISDEEGWRAKRRGGADKGIKGGEMITTAPTSFAAACEALPIPWGEIRPISWSPFQLSLR